MKTVTFKVNIDSGNDAFQSFPATATLNILDTIRGKLFNLIDHGLENEQTFLNGPLMDNNGNSCGYFEFSVDEED